MEALGKKPYPSGKSRFPNGKGKQKGQEMARPSDVDLNFLKRFARIVEKVE